MLQHRFSHSDTCNFFTMTASFKKYGFKRLESVATGLTAVTYLVCRIAIWPYMLSVYGKRINRDVFGAFASIPMQCKVGFSLMSGTNLVWWVSLVAKILSKRKKKNHGL